MGDGMEKGAEVITELIEEGKQFTYDSFARRSERGYPEAFSPEWVAWRTRVVGAIRNLFGDTSAPYAMLEHGLRTDVLGWGPERFDTAQSYFLGALGAAAKIVHDDVFGELEEGPAVAPGLKSNRVFIVHGHDEAAKTQLEALLGEMGLEPVVLHRKPDEGLTILEKFEKYSDVGFAFVLLTPDEVAYLADAERQPDADRPKELRARPNVLFEFGFFVGRLGRANVCCLHRDGVTLPSDLHGLLYKPFSSSVEEAAWGISKELKARGYKLR